VLCYRVDAELPVPRPVRRDHLPTDVFAGDICSARRGGLFPLISWRRMRHDGETGWVACCADPAFHRFWVNESFSDKGVADVTSHTCFALPGGSGGAG